MTTLAARFGSVLFSVNRLRVGWRVSLFLSAFILFSGISYMPIVALLLTTWLMARYIDRRPLISVGFVWEKVTASQVGLGAAVAAAMMSLIALILVGVTPSQLHNGVLGENFWGALGMLLLLHFVAALFEEMLVRGYLLQTLMESLGPWVALVATSAVFALIHIGNPGLETLSLVSVLALSNLFLAGVFLGALVLKTRALWAAISFHFAWNVIQGHVYGMPVSGQDLQSVYGGLGAVPEFWSVTLAGPDWLTGGAFGPEASVLTSVLLIVGTRLVWNGRWLQAGPRARSIWQEHVPVRGSQLNPAPSSAPNEA